MTLEEVFLLLQTTGFPVTYRAWPENEAPALPYISYLVAYRRNFAADGVVYAGAPHVQIELYTAIKDPEAEERVEKALSSVFWEKTEAYIESEKCYQITYEIEV